jgi:hypothetical protein
MNAARRHTTAVCASGAQGVPFSKLLQRPPAAPDENH